MLAPLKHLHFRWLWAGMGLSYAGDRLQELAQGWLVATLTGSALAVGGIGVFSSIPMLLMPLGGVISERNDRRRVLLTGQWVGAVITGGMAYLAFTGRIAVWQIYLWAFISGLVWMFIRPAYKVIVTEAVSLEEVRAAVSLSSITETSALVITNAAGSGLISWLGLPVAFLLNSSSYLVALFCLARVKGLGKRVDKKPRQNSIPGLFSDLKDGLVYLAGHKELLHPLLLTLFAITLVTPCTSLLPAIVYSHNGTIVHLGLLGGAASLGALSGALFAGIKAEGNTMRTYSLFGLLAAIGLVVFTSKPVSLTGGLSIFMLGFLAFAPAVWNTSRVPRLADSQYQARLQSLTSMAFTLGTPLGALWGGVAVDQFGLHGLLGGASLLAVVSFGIWMLTHR